MTDSEDYPLSSAEESDYTIVSAAHNVQDYLDAYFASIVGQTMGLSRIRIMLVDDGSTDSTAAVVKRWQAEYPDFITYLYQPNAGQAAARNLGLQHVVTEWVTFIDPDDFVDGRYFEEVDRVVSERHDLQMVNCNCVYYYESEDREADRHPLRARFREDVTCFEVTDPGQYIQLSASTAFFRVSIIRANGLSFDERIRPNFEDVHFVGNYLLGVREGSTCFLRAPRYYYRKRADRSSTLDTGWRDKRYFGDGLRYGCLHLLETWRRERGHVPQNIQRTVLYHLSWQLKGLLDNDERVAFLSAGERAGYLRLLEQIFGYTDVETIMSFEGRLLEFLYKVGILKAFKNLEPPYHITYVEGVDLSRRQILIRAFASDLDFRIDGRKVRARLERKASHSLAGRPFVDECVFAVPFDTERQSFAIASRGGIPVKVRAGRELLKAPVVISRVGELVSQHSDDARAERVKVAPTAERDSSSPTVSIIIPVFNAGAYLRDCLDSVLAQTFGDFEVICVDDGSTDSSPQLLGEYAAKDRRISVVAQVNAGAAVARNRGLEVARGEYVLFVDADDFVEPDLLEAVLQLAHDDAADVCVFGFDSHHSDSQPRVRAANAFRRSLLPDRLPFSCTDVPDATFRFTNPSVWNKLFRRTLIEDAGLRFVPELRYAQDLPFTYGILVRASRITGLDRALYHYRRDAANSLMTQTRGVAPCDALAALEQDLKAIGRYGLLRRPFENLVTEQAEYTLGMAASPDEFIRLHDTYSTRWASTLADRPADHYFKRHHYELAASIASGDALSSSMLLQREARRSAIAVRDRLTLAEENLRCTQDELLKTRKASKALGAIRESRAYRIGRAITFLPRLVRDRVRRSY